MESPEFGVIGDVMIIGRRRLAFEVVAVVTAAWLLSSIDITSLRRLLFMALASPPSEGPDKSAR